MIQASFPVVGVRQCGADELNHFLHAWGHPLDAVNRPYGRHDWLLEVDGRPVAVASSASIVSSTVAGYGRKDVVELSRIARAPGDPAIMRVMLRLWREYLARRWPYWPVRAAVSYQLPGTTGNLYRFDGWERVGTVRRSGGGGTWTATDPKVSKIGDGRKTLWLHRYD